MIQVELKPLFARLNPLCRRALEDAAGAALSRGHHEITIEHVIARLLETPDADWPLMLGRLEIDVARMRALVDEQLGALRGVSGDRPVFSPLLVEWIQDGWLASSVTLGGSQVRSGALLVALVSRRSFYALGAPYADAFGGVGAEQLGAKFTSLTEGSREAAADAATPGARGGAASSQDDSPIARFCEDFTAKAAAGRIDPVFGRDDEIRQMVDILARRRKNNPICVGDPGVGKTAVVEGLALRIVENDVPAFLRGVRLIGLDMGLLEAGAGVKGEFERRLRGVIDEVKAATIPTILFIDEAHMLVGAGGSAGGSDAANLLKPALARGELRTIAATTWNEYRKYFEKDPALARRFQLVKLDEPDVATAVQILRGLKDRYESAHGVIVRDDAIVAAAELSDRYITARQLPDKAVDLLDTAAARVKIGLDLKPAALERLERRRAGLERERDALSRDARNGVLSDAQRLGDIDGEIAQCTADYAALMARWSAERAAATRVVAAREALTKALGGARETAASSQAPNAAGAAGGSASDAKAAGDASATNAAGSVSDSATVSSAPATEAGSAPRTEAGSAPNTAAANSVPNTDTAAGCTAELVAARQALTELRGAEPLVFIEVGPDVVARVVSDWTGVPLGKLQRDRAAVVGSLADTLSERIRGQRFALERIGSVLKGSAAGLKDPSQPLGVFLLVGPSGVGKTETALACAEQMFGGEEALVTINMSEFQEKHTTSRLVGSPPGYVGYGEGGVLTEAVRQRPYCGVLLDEVEKAHLDVLNLFYQVFDKGMLSDGQGREVDFSNTIVFLTSNLAGAEIAAAVAEGVEGDALVERVRPILSAHFKPALLARMTIVPYVPLAHDALASIVRLKFGTIAARVAATSRLHLVAQDDVLEAIAARCTEVETGARNVDFILRRHVLPALSDELLAIQAEGAEVAGLRIVLGSEAAGQAFVIERLDEPRGGETSGPAGDAAAPTDQTGSQGPLKPVQETV